MGTLLSHSGPQIQKKPIAGDFELPSLWQCVATDYHTDNELNRRSEEELCLMSVLGEILQLHQCVDVLPATGSL